MMFRRLRLMLLNMFGRGYPPIIYIEPGEDPTKDRREMISAIDTGRLITVAVMVLALCPVSYAASKVFFKPKIAAAEMMESTAEATMEMSQEPTLEPSQEAEPTATATPVIIVITATATPTYTPTFTPTATHTPTATTTAGPGELWPVWMTATQFEKDFFGQNQEATELPYWRIHVVTATQSPEGQ